MIVTYKGAFSENFNKKILSLTITAMQQLIIVHEMGSIMDKLLKEGPDQIVPKKYLNFMYDEYYDNPLRYLHKEAIRSKLFKDIEIPKSGPIMEDSVDSRFTGGSPKIGGPSWTTIERKDPDGYVRKLLVGVLIKGKHVDNKLIMKILKDEQKIRSNQLFKYLYNFLRRFAVLKHILLYYDVLKAKLSTDFSYEKLKDFYSAKKVILEPEGFVFLNELDILNSFGEDFKAEEMGKFQKVGWKNVVIDVSSQQMVMYWGQYSGKGLIAIPYRQLISQISDRITVDEYLDVRDQSKSLFKYSISKRKATKIIRKALKR